jgi:hypothetical protein
MSDPERDLSEMLLVTSVPPTRNHIPKPTDAKTSDVVGLQRRGHGKPIPHAADGRVAGLFTEKPTLFGCSCVSALATIAASAACREIRRRDERAEYLCPA